MYCIIYDKYVKFPFLHMEYDEICELIDLEYHLYEHSVDLIACINGDFKRRLLANILNLITKIISKCSKEKNELRREIILESRLIIYTCIMFTRMHLESDTKELQVLYDENHDFDETECPEIPPDNMNVIDKSLSFLSTKKIYEECNFHHITKYIKWLLTAFKLEEDSILIKAEKLEITREKNAIELGKEILSRRKEVCIWGTDTEMQKDEEILIEREKELHLREKNVIEKGVVYIKCLTIFIERLCTTPKSELITFLKDRFDIIVPALIIMTKKVYGDDYVVRNSYHTTRLKIDLYDVNYLEIALLLNLDVFISPEEYEAYFNDKMKLFLEL